jgi:hypothetical protein
MNAAHSSHKGAALQTRQLFTSEVASVQNCEWFDIPLSLVHKNIYSKSQSITGTDKSLLYKLPIKNGIQKGDVLSPLLFISDSKCVISEVLGKLLRRTIITEKNKQI